MDGWTSFPGRRWIVRGNASALRHALRLLLMVGLATAAYLVLTAFDQAARADGTSAGQPTPITTIEKPVTNAKTTAHATVERAAARSTLKKQTGRAIGGEKTAGSTVDKPAGGATVEKPAVSATVEKPAERATVDKPAVSATVEKPAERATVDKPAVSATKGVRNPAARRVPTVSAQPLSRHAGRAAATPAATRKALTPATNRLTRAAPKPNRSAASRGAAVQGADLRIPAKVETAALAIGIPLKHNLRSPLTHNLRSPLTHNLRSPLTHNLRSPLTHNLRSPLTHNLRSPLARLTAPASFGSALTPSTARAGFGVALTRLPALTNPTATPLVRPGNPLSRPVEELGARMALRPVLPTAATSPIAGAHLGSRPVLVATSDTSASRFLVARVSPAVAAPGEHLIGSFLSFGPIGPTEPAPTGPAGIEAQRHEGRGLISAPATPRPRPAGPLAPGRSDGYLSGAGHVRDGGGGNAGPVGVVSSSWWPEMVAATSALPANASSTGRCVRYLGPPS
ncbi:hypothetical protein KOI35_08790 [Actinoplanes bogorensis]|uniref:Uncharacterized protein n=1 Tax=Paractinoplanes bogorensis TaxID=1610840 RepID=A0ABS5YJV5_9ACTN|nr:hypothetical protein [Actinoplanes bogorensis]MBU2663601.1 hypothetical protein [Actinoplanes bogorensis]